MKFLRVFFAFLFVSMLTVTANAAWHYNGDIVSSGNDAQMTGLSAASDGAGGMVVVWSTDEHVYAKRYDSAGAIVSGWTLVTVGDVEDTPLEAPRIIFNGTYWYVAWVDPHMVAGGGGPPVRGFIVRVAKLKSTGSAFHSANVFTAATSNAETLTMATRSGGGVAVGWEDDGDGYLQYFRTDLNTGSSLQIPDLAPTASDPLRLVANNTNGSIVIYSDGMGQAAGVDSTASPVWSYPMLDTDGYVDTISAVSDGSGGAVMAFDVTYTTDHRIWLQHVNSSGATQWNQGGGVTGQPLCVSSCSNVGGSQLVLNSAGTDAILTWNGGTGGSSIYAQKLPISGFDRAVWGSGKLVTSNDTGYDIPIPVSNANGYTTVVWNSLTGGTVYGIHYQILEDDGDLLMASDGTVTALQPQLHVGSIVASDHLNALEAWWVYDAGTTYLRAERLTPFGGVTWDYNPDRCQTTVSWKTSASGTTNRLDYRHLGASPWTTKTPGGSAGSYNSFYPQYVASEFRLRTTISSVEYDSPIYTDYGECEDSEPGMAPRAENSVNEIYLKAQPNPFNPVVQIGYGVPGTSNVELAIYDVSGGRVKTLVSGVRNNGAYTATWVGDNDRGERMASGIYFSRLTVGGRSLTQKLVMLK